MTTVTSRNFVRLFQPRFAPLVESGEKRQTVRLSPKRMPRAGDHISLREWTGKPYRSKQRVLRGVIIENVRSIGIRHGEIMIDGVVNSSMTKLNSFARADGFKDWDDLRQWFNDTHGLPFDGILITW